jgi:GNAT superfamily N-acetyltransferase
MTEIRLVPMTETQYDEYREHAEQAYAVQIAESGSMTLERAVEHAAREYAILLPDGLNSPGQHLFHALAGPDAVGMIWLQILDAADDRRAFVVDLKVEPDQRRGGLGTAIMLAADELCRARGVRRIGANVFGTNAASHALLAKVGYRVATSHLSKTL